MQIESVRAVPGVSAFYFDDQAAITDGACRDGFTYDGDPQTPGYKQIREPGQALLIEIELADGLCVSGDCAAVQYSGVGDRDPLFRAADHVAAVEQCLGPELVGRDAAAFVENERILEQFRADGKPLHTAVRYGVSQALVAAAAAVQTTTQTNILADALQTSPATAPVPVFGQSGDDRRLGAEKMILRGVPVLPHGLFNTPQAIGDGGEGLIDYLSWLSDRVRELGPSAYAPRFHTDVYGLLGDMFGTPYDRAEVVDYFRDLRQAAEPFPLQVEEPIKTESRSTQITALGELHDGLADAGVAVELVADEWCDRRADIETFVDAGVVDLIQVKTPDVGGLLESGRAVGYCAGTDTRAYLGGTCNETTRSAQTCAHLGLATDAAQILAKPGMGFDEGFAVITNEMHRALARNRQANTEVPASHRD